jgi:flagellar biosynthesis protein FlhF
METKEFWGRDMNEALQAVRAALGSDALILQTLSVPDREGGGGGERIKVTAMGEQAESMRETTSRAAREQGKLSLNGDAQPAAVAPRQETAGIREGLEPRGLKEIGQHLADLRSLLCWMIPGLKQSGVLGELIQQDAPPELLARLLQETTEVPEPEQREYLRQSLIRLIPTGGDIEAGTGSRVCLALIGPPGVGKTSAVVKLTVHLQRGGERRIGWINLDNRRVTGVEELTVYAGILGVPCEVAEGADGFAQALARLSACDLILVDTPGVSPRDAAGLSELAGVLQEQAMMEVRRSLVLSAATNSRELATWVQRYGRVGFDSLLFSMVDACAHFGPLVNTVLTSGRPLAYLATGQSVTQGLEVARPETVANLLLPE